MLEGLTITNKYKVVFSDLTRKPTLKLNAATGLFTGSILLPNGKKSTLKGLLLDNANNNVLGYATGATMNLKLSIFDPG